jgi:addiction module HigA family antidote
MARMKEYPVARPPKMPPTHPGAILREDVLPALGISVSEAARELGISRQTLHAILAERAAISPEMALRLGKFCGNGPELWLNMQNACDLWRSRRELAPEIARIPTRRAAA